MLLFMLSFLLPHLLSSWLVPGGFAWRRKKKNDDDDLQTAPGPTGWPILGCIPIMGPLAHRKLANLAKSHEASRLMALSLGTTPVVISSHPDTAKQILSGPAFSDRPVKTTARLLMFERAIGFAPSGEYWRHLRRIAATNMFSPRRVAASEGLRQRVADEMMQEVWRGMEEGGGRVVMRGVLQKGSLESVVGSVFGSSSLGGAEKEQVVEMVREGYELIGSFNWGDHFPSTTSTSVGGLFDLFGVKRRCLNLSSRVKCLFSKILEERRRSSEGEGEDDFLSVLLSLPVEERLCDSDIIAILWVSLSLSLITLFDIHKSFLCCVFTICSIYSVDLSKGKNGNLTRILTEAAKKISIPNLFGRLSHFCCGSKSELAMSGLL